MERREAIRNGNGGLVLTLIKPAHIPADQQSVMKPSTEGFYQAWEEASLAQYWGEHKRSDYYYHQTLKLAPEDIKPEALAEVLEGMNHIKGCLAEDEHALSWVRAAGSEDPLLSVASPIHQGADLASHQQIEPEPDGSIILTLKVGDLGEVKRWLIGFGAEAKVLVPDELREEIATECERFGNAGGDRM
jgi:hypothetical protein